MVFVFFYSRTFSNALISLRVFVAFISLYAIDRLLTFLFLCHFFSVVFWIARYLFLEFEFLSEVCITKLVCFLFFVSPLLVAFVWCAILWLVLHLCIAMCMLQFLHGCCGVEILSSDSVHVVECYFHVLVLLCFMYAWSNVGTCVSVFYIS